MAQPRLLLQADVDSGRLVEILRSHAIAPLPMHALYPDTRFVAPKVRAFLDFLSDRFRPPRAAIAR